MSKNRNLSFFMLSLYETSDHEYRTVAYSDNIQN